MRATLVVVVVFLVLLFAVLAMDPPGTQAQSPPDPRFIFQTQAGLSAYAQITGSLSISYVRPLYLHVDLQNAIYILGDYQLAGTAAADAFKLLIHRDGWALAYHQSRNQHVGYFPCFARYDYNNNLAYMPNCPEAVVKEVAVALGVTNTTPAYYDFRYPQATHVHLSWIPQKLWGQSSATVNLPLANTYYDRGFYLGTSSYLGEMYLNGQLLGSVNMPNRSLYGSLTESQLRAGYTNGMEVALRQLFTTIVVGGVGVVYSGDAPITTSGAAYRRDLDLSYPAMLGEPITVYSTYLPLVRRS